MSGVKTVAFKLLVMVPDILLGPQCEGIEDRPQLESLLGLFLGKLPQPLPALASWPMKRDTNSTCVVLLRVVLRFM